MNEPVVLIIFNRPDETDRVFKQIASAKPRRLFVIADGPRFPEEEEACLEARRIATTVDWDCDLEIEFSDRNLGCRERVVSGLDFVFERCEAAIILEDDCVPDASFFPYCAELLQRFRGDSRVTMISGQSFWSPRATAPASYLFSRHALIWGWATWRRAWDGFDPSITAWHHLRQTNWLETLLGNPRVAATWAKRFDEIHDGLDTWDYQWTFAMWRANALCAASTSNLISNIGFGDMATHTKKANSAMARLPAQRMEFPLSHPAEVRWSPEIDSYLTRLYAQMPERVNRRTRMRARVSAAGRRLGRATSQWIPR